MSQTNHNECWIKASDPPNTQRRVIIWTKRPWLPKTSRLQPLPRHLDMDGAWYSKKDDLWFHGDGHLAKDVTHWMEMPRQPKRDQK